MDKSNNELWQKILLSFKKSKRKITLFEAQIKKRYQELNSLKINSNSVLGSIILNSSGIIVDDWIRILGSEGTYNKGILWYNEIFEIENIIIIAHDIVGGIFAIDNFDEIWYFAPDTLAWENLEINYAQFINWVLEGDIDLFYNTMRWNSWQTDCQNVKFDEGMLIYPFLWSNEIEINEASKKIVPIEELFDINLQSANVINDME